MVLEQLKFKNTPHDTYFSGLKKKYYYAKT